MPMGEGKPASSNGCAPSPPQSLPKAVAMSMAATTKPKAPPVPAKSYSHPIPPPCPTPDYDTLSISSSTCSTLPRNINPPNTSTFRPHNNNNNRTANHNVSKKSPSQSKGGGISDTVEMESLESFKLTNPSSPRPKPPSTYFKTKSSVSPQSSNGSTSSGSSSTATMMRRQQKPVSVTIGEYPTGSHRREPGKFEFLHQAPDEVDHRSNMNGNVGNNQQSVSSKFASELANTLQRSNLRRRTESMENILNGQHQPPSPHANGSVTISVNKSAMMNSKNLAKSTNDLSSSAAHKSSADKIGQMLANRVTISVPSSSDVRKNGILKNGHGNSDFCADHHHRPVLHQKSITFGEM